MDVLGLLRAAGVHQQFHQPARPPLGNDVQAGPPLVVRALRVAAALEQRDAGSQRSPPIGNSSRQMQRSYPPLVADELVGVGVQATQKAHAARVAALRGVVDRREALAVPLVHVGARVDQRLEARGVGPGTPVLGLRLLRARDELEIALVVITSILDAVPQLHLPLDHAHLDAGHDQRLALVRRRANLAQFVREPASGVASMASMENQRGVKTTRACRR